MKNRTFKSVLILPDLQVPYEDKLTLKAVEQYMAEHKWDEVVYLGDFMDFDVLAKMNKDALRLLEGKRLMLDYAAGNAILDRHQKIVHKNNPHCKWTLIEGNHEYRIESAIDKMPALEGLIEVEQGLRLKERGFNWVRFWTKGSLHKIGNAYFSHGKYTNQYHASKTVNQYGVCIYYGHTHDVMSMPKVLYGKDKTLEGHSMGCLCRYDQTYIKGSPTKWQQAFGVGYFFPDGNYNIYVVRIFRHRFISPDGKVFPHR